MMVPLVLTHSTGQFVGDVFTGKGSGYLAVESRTILPGLARAFDLFTGSDSSLGQLILRTQSLVPFVALLLVAIGIWQALRQRRGAIVAIVAFAFVGFAVAAPDFGPQHLTEAMPLLLVLPLLAAGAWPSTIRRRLPTPVRRSLVGGTAAALVVGVIAVSSWAHSPFLRPHDRVTADRFAGFAGTMVSAVNEGHVRYDVMVLRQRTHGTVFLGTLDAGYYYLAADLRDPTSYDYPGRSDLGAGGELGAIRALERARVRWACIRPAKVRSRNRSSIEPVQLERYVRHSYRLVQRLHNCDLYERRVATGVRPVVRPTVKRILR